MIESICRLSEITINNFKNVRNGSVVFENASDTGVSSILGIYGQNGSGKTALIEVLAILSYILKGEAVPGRYSELINVDAEEASVTFGFCMTSEKGVCNAEYTVFFRKGSDDSGILESESKQTGKDVFLEIFRETLSASFSSDSLQLRKKKLIDTETDGIIQPAVRSELFLGNISSEKKMGLIIAKNLLRLHSKSFIFSGVFRDAVRADGDEKSSNREYLIWRDMLERLRAFGRTELFIIGTVHSGMISMDRLPLMYSYEEDGERQSGMIELPLNAPVNIEHRMFLTVQKVVNSMNLVLEKLVPGLSVAIRNHGGVSMPDGSEGVRIELMSAKNSREIPLSNESEGIKKIISVLQLLVAVFRNPSVTVAIDEIDSGVFEYLLGEMLRIISEHGNGQLVFTSHNLRPLETISKNSIVFTTVNPDNRYIRMANVKSNNNLRNFYFRDMVMAEQKEVLYDYVNNAEIVFSFMEAGEGYAE